MKSIIKMILAAFLFLICWNSVQAAENPVPLQKSDAQKSIIALNYCTFSLVKIATYNDSVVLDDEYTNIINAINLKNIPDKTVVDIITQLMSTMTKFRLSEMDKEKLFKIYEDSQQKTVMTMVSGISSEINMEGVSVTDPISMLAAGGSAYVAYQQRIKTNKDKLVDHTYSMAKDSIKEINDLNISFLKAYWEVLRNSDVPDEWRVSEGQFKQLLTTAEEPDPATRHRSLLRLEGTSKFIPAYWYYRADAAHAALRKGEKGNFAEDIVICLEHYSSFAGFLRIDSLLADLLMFHIASADLPPEKVRQFLNDAIVGPFPQDASKRLFAALTCLRYGFYDEAAEHLQANIDLKQFEVVSRTLLSDVYTRQNNTDARMALLRELLENASTSNQEILFQLGAISDDEQFLRRIAPEVSAIALRVDSKMLGQDDVLLTLPARWLLAENEITEAALSLGEQKIVSASLEAEKDGKTVTLTFAKAVDYKKLLEGGGLPVKIELPTSYFPLIVTGKFEPVRQEAGSTIGKWAGKVSKALPIGDKNKPNTMLFSLEGIQSGASRFSWIDGVMKRASSPQK